MKRDELEIAKLWNPNHTIGRRTRIVTSGVSFAQHFTHALVARCNLWVDYEQGPAGPTLARRKDYHCRTSSYRSGKVYTPKMLPEWMCWALTAAAHPAEVRERDGRFHEKEPERTAAEELLCEEVILVAFAPYCQHE